MLQTGTPLTSSIRSPLWTEGSRSGLRAVASNLKKHNHDLERWWWWWEWVSLPFWGLTLWQWPLDCSLGWGEQRLSGPAQHRHSEAKTPEPPCGNSWQVRRLTLLTAHPDHSSGRCRTDVWRDGRRVINLFEHNSLHLYLLVLLCLYKAAFNLPVELCVFNKRVHVSIPNEHVAPHTGETLRVILLLPGNLFDQGDGVMKHTARALTSKRGRLSLSSHSCLEAFAVSGCARGYPVDWALKNSVFFQPGGNKEAGRLWMLDKDEKASSFSFCCSTTPVWWHNFGSRII